MTESFVGTFPENIESQVPAASYKFSALRDLYKSVPGFSKIAMPGMKSGKERSHQPILLSGRSPDRVDNISGHNTVVALAANSIADFVGLNSSERNILVTAAGLHDISKVIELDMMGYRGLTQDKDEQGKITNPEQLMQAKKILHGILTDCGIIHTQSEFDQIAEIIGQLEPMEFIDYFDKNINLKFLINVLSVSKLVLKEEEKKTIITVASADSLNQLPTFIARVAHLAKSRGLADKAISDIDSLVGCLKAKSLLPEISGEDQVHLMAMSLVYCDGISQGDQIVTIDDRMNKLIAGGKYRDTDEAGKNLYGMGYFEANRIAMHGAESILTNIAVRNNLLPENARHEDFPKYVFENILRRADARITKKV